MPLPTLPIGLPFNRSSSPWTPAALSPSLWLDSSGLLYTDVGGTTPATADGNAIRNAPDLSGGAALTQAGGLVLRIENGLRVFGCEGGYLSRNVSSGNLSAFSCYAIVKLPAPSANVEFLSFGADATQPFLGPQWVIGNGIAYGISTSGQGESHCNYAVDNNWRVVAWIYNGVTIRTFLDGAEIGPDATGTQAVAGRAAVANFARGGHAVGKCLTFSQGGVHRFAELALTEGVAHDPAVTLPQADAYLRAKWSGLLNTTDAQVTYVGNSLMQNLAVAANATIPDLIRQNSATAKRFVNASRPSITDAQMLTRAALDYAKFGIGGFASAPKRVCVIWDYTNSFVVGGRTAAQAYADAVATKNALAPYFDRFVTGTCIDRFATGFQAFKNTVNPLILANSGGFDRVFDLTGIAGISADGAAPATSNANFADTAHLTAAGNGLAYPNIKGAVELAITS